MAELAIRSPSKPIEAGSPGTLRGPQYRYTVEDYLSFERGTATRHEYFGGNIYAMTGASEPHNLITGNVLYCLKSQLRGRPCKVYSSDMRLKVAPTGLFTYPDVMALCGDVKLSDDRRDTIENPQVVIEVLSKSTETYDCGEKLDHYKRLESVTDCVLVAQDTRRVEHHARQPDGTWKRTDVTETGLVQLPSIGCELPLDEIYEQIEFLA